MNKIIVESNKLQSKDNGNFSIKENAIIFKSNMTCCLEYVNSSEVDLEIKINDNLSVTLFIWSTFNDLKSNLHYFLGKNSELIIYQFYLNESTKEKIVVDLNGEGAKVRVNFSSLTKKSDDYHMVINHNEAGVSSFISNKSIALDESKLHFIIDSVLPKGNGGCVMDQTTKILTLGDAFATIEPNMFISEDDVEARHGSVISSFNEDDIFYLMSRGIDRAEAMKLLIKGFIFSNLNTNMEWRSRILEYINEIWG